MAVFRIVNGKIKRVSNRFGGDRAHSERDDCGQFFFQKHERFVFAEALKDTDPMIIGVESAIEPQTWELRAISAAGANNPDLAGVHIIVRSESNGNRRMSQPVPPKVWRPRRSVVAVVNRAILVAGKSRY